jgi:hypothetical protein
VRADKHDLYSRLATEKVFFAGPISEPSGGRHFLSTTIDGPNLVCQKTDDKSVPLSCLTFGPAGRNYMDGRSPFDEVHQTKMAVGAEHFSVSRPRVGATAKPTYDGDFA